MPLTYRQNKSVLAAAQRPIDLRALGESFRGEPTWRKTPSWALVSVNDSSIPPAAQRSMAKRAQATVVEVNACHASPLSHPHAVAALIEAASI
ncbi:alpha/beta fold hydrolase [Occallatibacter savannae]|uniref:alpha/beta fold hydrolase n=1 Tax=Occallatibacter savannae TaxID=1002691 RepID=UPI003B8308FD